MRMRGPTVLVGLSLLAAAGWAQQPGAPAALEIRLDEDTATVEGLTVGEDVVLFTVSRQFPDSTLEIRHLAQLGSDADEHGTVELDLQAPAPHQSVWVAVGLTSGRSGVSAPSDYPLRTGGLRPGAIQARGPGPADVLDESRRHLFLLLVRPGVGAWEGAVGDGWPSDADARGNGRVRFALDQLEPLAGTPALQPANVRPGDVVVAIDADTLETFVSRAPGAPQIP
jgi:hypothetical protein